MNHRKFVKGAMIVALLSIPSAALATNGYFSHGYGMKGKGMAGATATMAQDAFAGANNPASGVWAGGRLDLGVDWFSPRRKVTRSGSGGGALDFSADSDSTNFFVPEIGYNAMHSADVAYGITV